MPNEAKSLMKNMVHINPLESMEDISSRDNNNKKKISDISYYRLKKKNMHSPEYQQCIKAEAVSVLKQGHVD